MKKMRGIAAILAILAVLMVGGWALAEGAAALKCPVSGKAADPTSTLEFNDGKVSFCCENCPGAFKKDSTKYAAKANHQLVASGQFKQVACPFTGKPNDSEKTVDIDGVKVAFCCDNCKGKTEKSTDKVALVFNTLTKGFAKK